MTDTTAEVPVNTSEPRTGDDFDDTPAESQQSKSADDTLGDAGKQAIERMKAERNAEVKARKALEREIADLRKAQMNDSEKAVAEAETRGRQAATAEFGKRLARSSFDVLAAKRNPAANTDDIVEFVDMARFLTEDGDIDTKAMQAAVDRLIPDPAPADPSFDGGARTSSKAPNMNDIIRQQAGFKRSS